MGSSLNIRAVALIILGLLFVQATALYFMGQPLISASGEINLWQGVVQSPENSQQISDWYTFSHIIHGFLFYLLLHLLFPKIHPGVRLLLALGIEMAWEITENTEWLINHYRQQALAQGYMGDSILNSVCDSIAMIVGFVFAGRLPILATIAVGFGLELFVAYSIHDNLLLNIINLIYPFDFIHEWQSGS